MSNPDRNHAMKTEHVPVEVLWCGNARVGRNAGWTFPRNVEKHLIADCQGLTVRWPLRTWSDSILSMSYENAVNLVAPALQRGRAMILCEVPLLSGERCPRPARWLVDMKGLKKRMCTRHKKAVDSAIAYHERNFGALKGFEYTVRELGRDEQSEAAG